MEKINYSRESNIEKRLLLFINVLLSRFDLIMYFNEVNVHTAGSSMTPTERLLTHLGVMTHSLGKTALN